MNHQTPSIAQIRLLIPQEMMKELDTLAKVKLMTRLALIRRYLREQIDHDLSQLNDHFKRRDELKLAKERTENWIQQRQSKDEW